MLVLVVRWSAPDFKDPASEWRDARNTDGGPLMACTVLNGSVRKQLMRRDSAKPNSEASGRAEIGGTEVGVDANCYGPGS